MKRGLILEGGGAKGAYALGCLMAFHKYGIDFDVVAGSSVGALNAALLSTGRLELGNNLWRRLRFSMVCKPAWPYISWILLPFHLLAMALHRYPLPAALPFSNKQTPKKAALLIAEKICTTIVPYWFLFVVIAFFDYSIVDIFHPMLIMTIIFFLMCTFWGIPYLMRAGNLAFLTTQPLRSEINKTLTNASFKIPTYATVSFQQEMFDPDKPGYSIFMAGEIPTKTPIEQEEYVPRYVRLDDLSPAACIDVLTASAAIPFGVFPPIMLDDALYIDGGLADNIPLIPVLRDHCCDEVYVVRLRPDHDEELVRHWQKVDRRLRVATMDQSMNRDLYDTAFKRYPGRSHFVVEINPPVNVPYRKFPMSLSNIIVIAPKKSLGNFLRGTMNFNKRYTSRLIKQGYRDACQIIHK